MVGDDGCSAELREWTEGVAATDPRVRYLKAPQRVGLAGNWNFVAAHARGEFVTIIGDDDRLLPDFAGQMLSQATASVAVVFANHYVIDSTGRRAADASAITRRITHAIGLPPARLRTRQPPSGGTVSRCQPAPSVPVT